MAKQDPRLSTTSILSSSTASLKADLQKWSIFNFEISSFTQNQQIRRCWPITRFLFAIILLRPLYHHLPPSTAAMHPLGCSGNGPCMWMAVVVLHPCEGVVGRGGSSCGWATGGVLERRVVYGGAG